MVILKTIIVVQFALQSCLIKNIEILKFIPTHHEYQMLLCVRHTCVNYLGGSQTNGFSASNDAKLYTRHPGMPKFSVYAWFLA